MRPDELYIGQVVRFRDWDDMAREWHEDGEGDLVVVGKDGRVIDYILRREAGLSGFEFEVEEIRQLVDDEEVCFVLTSGLPIENIATTIDGKSAVHCYKLEPVEQHDAWFDETGFLNMLGMKGV